MTVGDRSAETFKSLYQFFMRPRRIRSPWRPQPEGGTRFRRPPWFGGCEGDRDMCNFTLNWYYGKLLKGGNVFFYATDSYAVYPKFIDEADQIASKSYMTRVEGENTKFLALLSTLA